MGQFKLVSPYQPKGDQPQAIEALTKGFEAGLAAQTLLGVTGSGKTFTMASVIERVQRPTLVIAHNKTLAAQLCSEFRAFFPDSAVEYFVSYYDYYQPEAYIASSDTYIEKDASINDEIDRLRHSATAALRERRDVIIVASVSCIYSMGDPSEYEGQMISLRPGMRMTPEQLAAKLVEIQYERNDVNFIRNKFRVRGDVVEIFPVQSSDRAVRVEFFGDEIDCIHEIDPLTGKVLADLKHIAIYPASHYIVPKEKIQRAVKEIEQEMEERAAWFTEHGKLIEAQRIRERTKYDMEMLLEQTQGTGVDVYTHSEMLPAHYYPAFKKYENFAGNYGNAWWKQLDEFVSFHGPILFTTNCIVPPRSEEVRGRIFTTGSTGYPGCKHIEADENGKKDFSKIIELAKTLPTPDEIETGSIVGGFAHNQVFALADKIVDAVKSGAIKKFFVMAGCDGRMKSREYYTEFAEKLPKDTVILTAGCAKYRYNKLKLGDINGIPRVLDAGQCNDSYSLVVIALKLKEVFGLDDINDLPIVYNIAWYEQKAVIVLLALLSLGVKNIHLGPTLPGFLSPSVAKVLIEKFGIAGVGTVDDDIKLFMNA